MRWERRRSKWPCIAALCGLFGLTLAAPWLLRRAQTQRGAARPLRVASAAGRNETAGSDSQSIAVADSSLTSANKPVDEPPMPLQPPRLPPLATGETSRALQDLMQAKFAQPAAAGSGASEIITAPILASDDYETFGPLDQGREMPRADDARAAGSQRSESAETTAGFVPAPPAIDVSRAFDVESILAVRAALSSLVNQMQHWELPKATSAHSGEHETPRVRVESTSDRLAMAAPGIASTIHEAERDPVTAAVQPEAIKQKQVAASPSTAALRVPEPVPPPLPAQPQASPSAPRADHAVQKESPQQSADLEPLLRFPPAELILQLEGVPPSGPHAAWASQALIRVNELANTPLVDPRDARRAITALEDLTTEASSRAATAVDRQVQSEWRRLGRAVARRLPLWKQLAESDSRGKWRPTVEPAVGDQVSQRLREIVSITAGAAEAEQWREYLLVDELSALTSVGADGQTQRRREAARKYLARVASPTLTDAQRRFVALPPIDSLRTLLKPWASGTVNLAALSGVIDRFEATGSARYGDVITEQIRRMQWSGQSGLEQLAEQISRDYRSANLRVALSGDLFNRMLPQQQTVVAPVRDRVAGSEVRGRSQTSTQLRVRLLPDSEVLRFGLEAAGDVRSHTYSETWPARVRNVGQMQYEARKLIVVNRHGLHVWPADADAYGDNRLVGVDSQLDPVPIVGSIVQNLARQQHRERRSLAMRQVRSRVIQQAESRMDREADVKLRQLERRFGAAVLRPLESLALAAEPLDMHTTEDRAVLRLRVASQLQLAAFTPRPSAPSDSLASLQLHESALNNATRGLQLEGRRMDAGELQSQLAEKLHRRSAPLPHGTPERASIQFDQHDAIRFRCEGDRVELILRIAELARGRDRIEDVEVHAFFQPILEGMLVNLRREGTLHFKGRRLLTAQRIVLHTVFGKLLPKDAEIALLSPPLEGDHRLADLMITQLVIDDGWLAAAVGPRTPRRVVWRTARTDTR